MGTKCGLAPPYGIECGALSSAHHGRIHLYHGSRNAGGLYLTQQMKEHPDLAGWRVFLRGNPQMVNAARLETFVAGAASEPAGVVAVS
ncbi:MAG: hypothetical protein ACHQIL_07565 [Steroidobacterales bacterium]